MGDGGGDGGGGDGGGDGSDAAAAADAASLGTNAVSDPGTTAAAVGDTGFGAAADAAAQAAAISGLATGLGDIGSSVSSDTGNFGGFGGFGSLGGDTSGAASSDTGGGFGAAADAAAAAAAATGTASGISGVSDTGFGGFGPSDTGPGGLAGVSTATDTGTGFGSTADAAAAQAAQSGLATGLTGDIGSIAAPSDAGFGFGVGLGNISGIGPSAEGMGFGTSAAAPGAASSPGQGGFGFGSAPPGANLGTTGLSADPTSAVAQTEEASPSVSPTISVPASFSIPAEDAALDATLGLTNLGPQDPALANTTNTTNPALGPQDPNLPSTINTDQTGLFGQTVSDATNPGVNVASLTGLPSTTNSTATGFGPAADDAAAQAAQTGLATGVNAVDSLGETGFGPTDATPGNNPANTPGFGSFSGVPGESATGFGSVGGGFGVGPGGGLNSAGSQGGVGGFGGFGNPGSFGTGIASDADTGFGIAGIGPTAAAFGLGPSDSLGISDQATQDALSQAVQTALSTLSENPTATISPAQMADAHATLAAAIQGQLGFNTSPTGVTGQFGSFSQSPSDAIGVSNNAPSFGSLADAIASLNATPTATTAPNFNETFGNFTEAAPGVTAAVNDPNNPNTTYGYSEPALGQFSNLAEQGFHGPVDTTAESLPTTAPQTASFTGFSPSPTGVVGVAAEPDIGTNAQIAALTDSPDNLSLNMPSINNAVVGPSVATFGAPASGNIGPNSVSTLGNTSAPSTANNFGNLADEFGNFTQTPATFNENPVSVSNNLTAPVQDQVTNPNVVSTVPVGPISQNVNLPDQTQTALTPAQQIAQINAETDAAKNQAPTQVAINAPMTYGASPTAPAGGDATATNNLPPDLTRVAIPTLPELPVTNPIQAAPATTPTIPDVVTPVQTKATSPTTTTDITGGGGGDGGGTGGATDTGATTTAPTTTAPTTTDTTPATTPTTPTDTGPGVTTPTGLDINGAFHPPGTENLNPNPENLDAFAQLLQVHPELRQMLTQLANQGALGPYQLAQNR